MNRIIQFFLTDGLLLREWSVAVLIQLGFFGLRLVLRQLGLRLIPDRLKRTRIDFKKFIAFLHLAAFSIILREQIAGNLGANLGVDESIESPDPFLEYGHIRGGGGNDLDFRRLGRRCFLLASHE